MRMCVDMEKPRLDKWECAFLYDGIANQIQSVREHIARFEDGSPTNLTDAECEVLGSLIDKIQKGFEFEGNEHFDWLKDRLNGLPKYRTEPECLAGK